jgi:hypothetical protein
MDFRIKKEFVSYLRTHKQSCMKLLYPIKTVIKPFVILFAICLLNTKMLPACNSDFTYSIASDGRTVTFTPVSATEVSYFWVFGDAAVSSTLSPVHTYGNHFLETYNVGLLVMDSSCRDSTIITITIGRTCEVGAAFGIIPDTADFSGLIENNSRVSRPSMARWTWHFGDGDSSNLINPTHVYAGAGDYLLHLIIRDSACFSEFSDSISFDTSGNLKRGVRYSIKVFGGPETSIREQKADQVNVRVMPNPGNGIVKIESTTGLISSVTIKDVLGREVYYCGMPGNLLEYDSSCLDPGLYFVMTDNGTGYINTIRFIKTGN